MLFFLNNNFDCSIALEKYAEDSGSTLSDVVKSEMNFGEFLPSNDIPILLKLLPQYCCLVDNCKDS